MSNSHIERGRQPQENHSRINNFTPTEEEKRLLSRRKFWRLAMGAGVGITIGSGLSGGCSDNRVNIIQKELEAELPKPSKHELTEASKKIELYKKRTDLYRQCNEINTLENCETLRPSYSTEVQETQKIIELGNVFSQEVNRRGAPWKIVSVGSILTSFISSSIVIRSLYMLNELNCNIVELQRLRKKNSPQKTSSLAEL
jgi:hypothetical protein